MTTPGSTPVCARGRQLQKWGGLFSLILPTVLIYHLLRKPLCRWRAETQHVWRAPKLQQSSMQQANNDSC